MKAPFVADRRAALVCAFRIATVVALPACGPHKPANSDAGPNADAHSPAVAQACRCRPGALCAGPPLPGTGPTSSVDVCSDSGAWTTCETDAGEAACAAACPKDAPANGDSCSAEATVCEWPAPCGASTLAQCKGGTWDVTNNPCACADPSHLQWGKRCYDPDVVCIDILVNVPVSIVHIAKCQGGLWTAASGLDCPPLEPAQGAGCEGMTNCLWENACGATGGNCVNGAWAKAPIPCPGTALTNCSPGTQCEPGIQCIIPCANQTTPPVTVCDCMPDRRLQCTELPCCDRACGGP
jgi:hypothetical protein